MLDRDLIAQTASELGLRNLTMQAVADRLGVSVASLYYHVQDRAELTKIAAEYAASRIRIPKDRDQHWSIWLTEWAEYSRAAFATEPVVLHHFMAGTLGTDRVMYNIDSVLGLLTRQGFTPEEAMNAYAVVSACAVGAAVIELRSGATPAVTTIDDFDSVRYPNLAQIHAGYELPSFDDQIYAVLVGIAVTRNEDPTTVRRRGTRRKNRRS
jgi:AcrR family transcriptional regulator